MIDKMRNRVNIWMGAALYERLQVEKERTGASTAELIRRALRGFLPTVPVEPIQEKPEPKHRAVRRPGRYRAGSEL